MPSTRGQRQPKTFFLNETHELTRGEKPGGGGLPKYEGIAWAAKGKKISLSLRAAANAIAASSDPLKNERLFLIAEPVDTVKKRREDKQGKLRETYDEIPRYGAGQGRLFDRLGLDLIDVTEDGKALVHAEASRIEQLRERTAMLDNVGPLEQSRWATINSFETIPPQLRVDSDWLNTLSKDNPNNVVIELQPVLSRFEADRVLRAIADLLTKGNGGKLTATGSDFSGRYWFRGNATRNAVRGIARDFYSVQAIHSPLFSLAAAKKHSPSALRLNDPVEIGAMPDVNELPCVAVVDLGIPKDHRQLAHFRRGQFYPPDTPNAPVGDHASFVASRIVFGDHDSPDALLAAAGKCSIFDAMVAEYPAGPGNQMNLVNDKAVMAAMQGVKGAAPDVRVFNLSFGDTRHLENFNQIDKEQKRLDLQHLDNFVFATDSIVVVAAGNSQRGVVPNPAYPQNFNDPRWALGPWACGNGRPKTRI